MITDEEEIETQDVPVEEEPSEPVEKKKHEGNATSSFSVETDCDPRTMDCSQMPSVMQGMIKEEMLIDDKLSKLNQIRAEFPEIPTVDTIKDSMVKRKEEINTKMDIMVERFSSCRPPSEKKDDEQEETDEQSEDIE